MFLHLCLPLVWRGVYSGLWGGECLPLVLGVSGRHLPQSDTTPPLPPSTTRYGQQAGSTHPTGIHSCSHCVFIHTLQETFETLKSWISELRKHGPVNIVLAVVGNKCDLEDLRQVQYKGK